MAEELIPYSQSRHPAPHRDRVRLGTLFYGLFAAPIAWAGNLMVTYGLAAHACYPGFVPLDQPVDGFGFVWPLVLACYLVTLLICASGFAVAYHAWRMTGSESEGHWHHLVEVGEGRTRYLSLIGMSFSALFFGATLFGAVVPAIEPLCVH
jgi:hypothetical protein